VGQFLECKDSVGKFLPAEVLSVSSDGGSTRIRVHFEGWSSRWDEELDVEAQAHRIRALGSALEESEQERLKKEEEAALRADLLAKHGLRIVDCDADGNCLFRALAHQVWGDVSRHAELRAACYAHMAAERSYFATFVAEDFDAYVAARRKDKAWGDHLEIVALREVLNRNIEIYSFDAKRGGCQSMGMAPVTTSTNVAAPAAAEAVPPMLSRTASLSTLQPSAQLVVLRLSFHGKNHYNSVVDPARPPPLEDGRSDTRVNFKLQRVEQEAVEAAAAKRRAGKEAALNAAAAAAVPAVSASPPPLSRTPSTSSTGSRLSLVRSSSSAANTVSPRRGLNSPLQHSSQLQPQPSPALSPQQSPQPSPRTPLRSSSLAGSAAANPLLDATRKDNAAGGGETASPRRSISLFRDTSHSSLHASSSRALLDKKSSGDTAGHNAPLLSATMFNAQWQLLDARNTGRIASGLLPQLFENLLECMYSTLRALLSSSRAQQEHLDKVYHELQDDGLELERLCTQLMQTCPTVPQRTAAGHEVQTVTPEALAQCFYAHAYQQLEWALRK